MKKYFRFILILLFVLFCSFQDAEPAKLHFSWQLLVAIVLAIYDVFARLIVTVKDISWLSWIIKLIGFLNEFLNRKKKK